MDLIGKRIEFEKLDVLYSQPFTQDSFARDFEVRGGNWRVENGWLIGWNPRNEPGMAISRTSFSGDVMLDFRAKTLLPSTHDINVMWAGEWDEVTNQRAAGYVAGIQGWWRGKMGFEKAPGYLLNAATQAFQFEPGRTYHVQCGSAQGHLFLCLDEQLILELTDPDPIDTSRCGRIGFEAYASQIALTDFQVKRLTWTPLELTYPPEF